MKSTWLSQPLLEPTRRSRSLLINIPAKSTRQCHGCDVYLINLLIVYLINLINLYVNIQTTNPRAWKTPSCIAVANCVLNRRFAAAAPGSCDGLPATRWYDGKCSLYFNCYFFRTTTTNWDLREKAVYFPPRAPAWKTGIRISLRGTASSADYI